MWLACYTQQQIAAAVGVTQQAISKVLQRTEHFRLVVKLDQLREIDPDGKHETERLDAIEIENREAAEHVSDFEEPPIYDVWKQQEKTQGSTALWHRRGGTLCGRRCGEKFPAVAAKREAKKCANPRILLTTRYNSPLGLRQIWQEWPLGTGFRQIGEFVLRRGKARKPRWNRLGDT
jgi:transcriptional regulator with XRE-family HTH domain